MPVNIFGIPKNGSSFLAVVREGLSSNFNIDIVVIRDPIVRFWSGVKEIYPPAKRMFIVESMIDDCVHFLDNSGDYSCNETMVYFVHGPKEMIYAHLKPQTDYIKENKFDYVFDLKTLNQQLNELIENGTIQTKIPLSEYNRKNFHHMDLFKESNHEHDDRALAYIRQRYSEFVNRFYAKDLIMYQNPSMLLKVNHGSSN